MLTTHIGETDIRKQEMHGIVEVGRSFVHIKHYNKHILIFYLLSTLSLDNPISRITICLNKRESTQPEDASTQIADFLWKWILRGKLFKDVFSLYSHIACLCKTNDLLPPLLQTIFLGIII